MQLPAARISVCVQHVFGPGGTAERSDGGFGQRPLGRLRCVYEFSLGTPPDCWNRHTYLPSEVLDGSCRWPRMRMNSDCVKQTSSGGVFTCSGNAVVSRLYSIQRLGYTTSRLPTCRDSGIFGIIVSHKKKKFPFTCEDRRNNGARCTTGVRIHACDTAGCGDERGSI
jgi:hypothetical protein